MKSAKAFNPPSPQMERLRMEVEEARLSNKRATEPTEGQGLPHTQVSILKVHSIGATLASSVNWAPHTWNREPVQVIQNGPWQCEQECTAECCVH